MRDLDNESKVVFHVPWPDDSIAGLARGMDKTNSLYKELTNHTGRQSIWIYPTKYFEI